MLVLINAHNDGNRGTIGPLQLYAHRFCGRNQRGKHYRKRKDNPRLSTVHPIDNTDGLTALRNDLRKNHTH